MSISRRTALRSLLGVGAAGLVPSVLQADTPVRQDTSSPEPPSTTPLRIEDPRQSYPNTSFSEKLYREEFAATLGSEAERGFAYHCVNCQGNCAWEVWVKDGRITRENQSRRYPQLNPGIPDPNPRGCNKGAQHSMDMVEKDRLLYPLKRVGKRGQGRWKRISWDEALTEIAEHLYATLLKKGPAGNYIHIGAGVMSEARGASFKRLGTLLGAVRPYIASYVGDMFPGVSLVYGEGNIGCTTDYFFTTDVAIFWGCNPNTSRIPDAHYLWEGKYNGSKVVVISPELNSTAVHADLWVPIKAGYDGHLAMSVMYEILTQELYDVSFIKTFTDLPLLVRQDSGRLLRLEDLDLHAGTFDLDLHQRFQARSGERKEHAEAIFLTFNQKSGKLTAMPGSEGSPLETLRLVDAGWEIDPALSGDWTVALKDGSSVRVRPVFSLLREEVEAYAPEKTQTLTGVHPELVQTLARDIARARNCVITLGFTLGKHFNGLLSQRAIASLSCLTGRLGPRGGTNTENEWSISGTDTLSAFQGRYRHRFASGFVSEFMLGGEFADNDALYEDADYQRSTGHTRKEYQRKLAHLLERSADDAGEGRGKNYWRAVETFLISADSRFRRNKGNYKDHFLKKARFFAYVDYRMSDAATWADIVLPARSHYEVWDIRTNPGYHRFANIAQPPANLRPVGESKSEWEIATLLVEKLEALARQKFEETGDERFIKIPDPTHTTSGHHALDRLVEEFTLSGRLRSDKDAVELLFEHVEQFKPNTLETAYARGGFLTLNAKAGKSSPLYPDQPYNTFENNLYLNERFETLTGRLTFYVDDPTWIEAGARLPAAHEPLRPRRFPLLLMTPHARWSIHSTYKKAAVLQRLQRGRPTVMIHPKTAEQRGIKDGDRVRLFNDLSDVVLMAKLVTGVPPDAVVMEHGWEPFMFPKKQGHNQLMAATLNLLEVSDGWGHLKFGIHWDGNEHAYAATVELARA